MTVRTDHRLQRRASEALATDPQVPPGRITVRVEEGVASLDGRCDCYYQRSAAERAVKYLPGVRGVLNYVLVMPAVSTRDVRSRIENALAESARFDARRIRIEANGGHVRLSGTVHSTAERDEAEQAAWSAPGVTAVEDQLVVA